MGNLAGGIRRFFASYDQKGLATLPVRSRLLAWFSSSAYQRKPPREHSGYVLEMNAPTVKVWVNHEMKDVVIAVRGTQGEQDVQTDIKVAIERETETARYQIAKTIVLNTLRKYKGYKITLTGHSLGGGIVYRLADEFPTLTGEVFNPAVNLKTIRNEQSTSRRVKAHIIDGDPVAGVLGRPLRNTQVYSAAYGAEREKIMKKPLKDRLLHLHALARFPMA